MAVAVHRPGDLPLMDRLIDAGLRAMHPTSKRGRLVRDAARLAGLAVVLFVWWLLTFNDYQHDARAYWALDLESLYERGQVGGVDAYLYSPAYAQLFQPFTWLPWSVFAGVWAALNLAVLTWMAGPVIAGLLLVIPGSPIIDEVSTGNIHLLVAAAIVIGFRWPAAWALPLLTKVTPGVGVLWFAGARLWRPFAIAVGATVAISAVSFVLGPNLWFDWADVLTGNVDRPIPTEIAIIPGPLWVRTLVAGAVAAVGGWRGWRWSVPLAATLALPVPWSSGLSVMVAVVALARQRLKVPDAAR